MWPFKRTDKMRGTHLVLDSLTSGYGFGDVIRRVSLDVAKGEIVAVLGPNGAGKTTMLRTVSGMLRPSSGSIRLGEVAISRASPESIVRMGIAQVPQGRLLFPYSTTLENLRIGAYTRTDRREVEDDIALFLDQWPILKNLVHRPASLLSGGEQQVVALGRALMSRPTVLLLDEPTLGLAPVLANQVFELIQDLAVQRGLAMLIVEQNARKTLEVAKRVYVLTGGAIAYAGPASDISPEDIAQLYFGSTEADRRRAAAETG